MFKALLFVTAGCGTSIHTTQLQNPPAPMVARTTVELFTGGPPSRPHVDVALLEAEEGGSWRLDATAEMLGDLRTRAAAMGCDGLVITSVSPDTHLRGDSSYRKTIVGTCIVYQPEPATMANQ